MRVFNRPGASRGRSTGTTMRYLTLAGAVALGLSACDGIGSPAASPPEQRPAAKAAPIEPRSAPAPVVVPPPPPPEWVYRRNERYRDYHLIQQSGPAIPGREFEAEIMCKNVFEAADYNMWALRNLVITGSRPGMTSFLGMVDGQQIEISLVMNEQRRTPTFLILGGSTVASCSPF